MTSMQMGQRTVRAIARLAIGLALAAAVPALAAAQQGGGPQGGPPRGPGGGRGMRMLLEGITLDAAQQAKVDSIRAVFVERGAGARRDRSAGGDAQARPDSAAMTARRQMMQEQQDAVRAVLTPEQQKTFDANVEKVRQRPRPDRGQQGGGGVPGR